MSSRLVANTVPKMLLRVSATHVTVLQLKLHPRLRHFQWLAVLATRWKQLPPPTNNVFVRPACHHVIVQFQNHMHVISCTAYPATSTAKMLASSCSLFSIHCLRCSQPFAAHPSPHCLRHTVEHVERNGKYSGRRALRSNLLKEPRGIVSKTSPEKTRLRATQNHNSTSTLQIAMCK